MFKNEAIGKHFRPEMWHIGTHSFVFFLFHVNCLPPHGRCALHLSSWCLTSQVSVQNHAHTCTFLCCCIRNMKALCDAVGVLSKAHFPLMWSEWKVRRWPRLLSCWHRGEELWLDSKHTGYVLHRLQNCLCFFLSAAKQIYLCRNISLKFHLYTRTPESESI